MHGEQAPLFKSHLPKGGTTQGRCIGAFRSGPVGQCFFGHNGIQSGDSSRRKSQSLNTLMKSPLNDTPDKGTKRRG